MSLQRRNTRFGLPLLRGESPDSDETDSTDTPRASDSLKKLRKRSLASRDDDEPSKIRQQLGDGGGEETRPDLEGFSIPQAIQPTVGVVGNMSINHSPWERLEKHFNLSLEGSVVIATGKDGRFVAVRKIVGPHEDRKIGMLQRIQGQNIPNILKFLEYFIFEGSHYAVFEHEIIRGGEKMSVTLAHYARIKRYPTEQQLAIILGQILEGLKNLASIGLEHGALTCDNILISTRGSIRIAGQECCRELDSSRGSTRDIRSVGYVTMELMHKEAEYKGPIKVRDVHRWPLDSEAVNFLLMTESAYSIDELIKHPLFRYKRQNSDMYHIKGNVYMAEISVFRGHSEDGEDGEE